MISFILVIVLWTGPLAKYKALSTINIPGFSTKTECEKAGEQAKALGTLLYSVKHVCLEQK